MHKQAGNLSKGKPETIENQARKLVKGKLNINQKARRKLIVNLT